MTTPSQRALILYRRQRYTNHLLTYFLCRLYPNVQLVGGLLSSICRTCPSHPSLLSFMTRFISSTCVCILTLWLLTLSFHEMPIITMPVVLIGAVENLWENAPTAGKCLYLGCLSLESDQTKNLKATYRRVQTLRIS